MRIENIFPSLFFLILSRIENICTYIFVSWGIESKGCRKRVMRKDCIPIGF